MGLKKKYLLIYSITFIFCLIAYEIYYRVSLYHKIKTHFFSDYFLLQNQTLHNKQIEVDKIFKRKIIKSECLFRANSTVDLAFVPKSNDLDPKFFSVQTNNLGVLSSFDYSFEKKKDEYRILFLGESFTGPTTATYQWVDTIQELLNKNKSLDPKIKFKTFNLGWVGGGFKTFIKEYSICGERLKPDLIIVNYLELDFPRANPGLIENIDLQIQNAKNNIAKLPSDIPIIFTVMPDYSEVMDPSKALEKTEMLKSEINYDFIDMREHLPMNLNKKKRESWFNLPHDAHYSDRGGELYARAISKVITKKIFSQDFDYFKIETKYSKQLLDYTNNNIRAIDHSFSKFIKEKELRKNLEQELINRTFNKIVRSRIFRKTPYVYDLILKKYHPINIPYNELNFRGFEKVYLLANNQPLLINIFCTKPPLELTNSNCYTHMHTFVNF